MPVEGPLGPQLPLALRAPADQRLERYLRAPSGLLEQLQSLASGDSGGALYLQGSAATGKTHLLLGSCALGSASTFTSEIPAPNRVPTATPASTRISTGS